MRPPHCTLRARDIQTLFEAWLAPVLGPWPAVRSCTVAAVCAVAAHAAHRVSSLFDACRRLADAPDSDTILNHLTARLDDPVALDRRLRAAFGGHLPRAVRTGRWPVALDLTLIPYHGRPFADEAEVYRGQPKGGTTHFHAYATAYLVRDGRRFTLALIAVPKGAPMADVARELCRRVRAVGVNPRVFLMDRGFNSAGVVRYLQAARYPFILPQAVHGKAPRDGSLRGLRAVRAHHPTGWTTYTWRPVGQARVTVDLCVCRRRRKDRNGHRAFLYACGGIRATPRWVKNTYRSRFGIETSYRQMHRARIRTTTRNPRLRLFFVAVALLLRNLWAWVHWTALARRRRGGRRVQLDRLRFATLLLWLAHLAEAAFRYTDHTTAEHPPTDDLATRPSRRP
jgi:Transposase DDE domain